MLRHFSAIALLLACAVVGCIAQADAKAKPSLGSQSIQADINFVVARAPAISSAASAPLNIPAPPVPSSSSSIPMDSTMSSGSGMNLTPPPADADAQDGNKKLKGSIAVIKNVNYMDHHVKSNLAPVEAPARAVLTAAERMKIREEVRAEIEAERKADEEEHKKRQGAKRKQSNVKALEDDKKKHEAEMASRRVEDSQNAEKAEEIKKEQEKKDKANGIIKGDPFNLTASTICAESKDIKGNFGSYTYMFWIKPKKFVGGWANIIHKGSNNGERNPAVWFYPSTFRLHIRSGTAQNANAGLDPVDQLPGDAWTHVAFAHDEKGLSVYFNGVEVGSVKMPKPVMNAGVLYCGDPWHSAADAELADLRYLPGIVDLKDIQSVVAEKRYKPKDPQVVSPDNMKAGSF